MCRGAARPRRERVDGAGVVSAAGAFGTAFGSGLGSGTAQGLAPHVVAALVPARATTVRGRIGAADTVLLSSTSTQGEVPWDLVLVCVLVGAVAYVVLKTPSARARPRGDTDLKIA